MSTQRDSLRSQLASGETFDVLVVGGGINGAVTAASLAARGVRVALVERGDFASCTSQQSSNLTWGGIKYLETYEFDLVRKLCVSRNHLMKSHPSQVREVRFFVAHEQGFRHGRVFLFLGALFYWFIGSFFTRAPRLLSKSTIAHDEPVIDRTHLTGGFEYSDAYLVDNDARFVWTFIRTALDRGAVAVNYTEVTGAVRKDDLWHVDVRDAQDGATSTVKARVLVNAAGPYVDALNHNVGITTRHHHVFSKGIHLIVPRITDHERVLTFFADDGRLFFAIPMGTCTCIGTTDTRVDAPETHVTPEDRRFVLDNINKRLTQKRPLTEADIIGERCGVRPLVVEGAGKGADEWFQLSRKHVVEVDAARRHISVFGGKLTDCLNVGNELARDVAALGVALPTPKAHWYGEPGDDVRTQFFARAHDLGLDVRAGFGEVPAERLWRRFGVHALELLDELAADARLREPVLPELEELRGEASFAARHEMVVTLEDWLRRRTRALLTTSAATWTPEKVRVLADALFAHDAPARAAEFMAAHTPTRVPAIGSTSSPQVLTAQSA